MSPRFSKVEMSFRVSVGGGAGRRPHTSETCPATFAASSARRAARLSSHDGRPGLLLPDGPNVCVGCCSQLRIWHDFGNRSYVSGLLIGSRAVALMGLRTRLRLISGKVFADHKGRQTLGAYFLRSLLSSLSRTPFDRGKRQMVSMAISLGASNRGPCRRTLHAVRASLLASATAALLRGMRFTASVMHAENTVHAAMRSLAHAVDDFVQGAVSWGPGANITPAGEVVAQRPWMGPGC